MSLAEVLHDGVYKQKTLPKREPQIVIVTVIAIVSKYHAEYEFVSSWDTIGYK